MNQGTRNVVLGVGAVVVIAASVALFARGSGKPGAGPSKFVVDGVCLACQKEGTTKAATDERPPYSCPNCGKKAFCGWFFCKDCGTRFVPELVRSDPSSPWQLPIASRCPACGSSNYDQWDSGGDQEVKGNAPLPKWSE